MKTYLLNLLVLLVGFYLYNKPDTASLFPSFLSNAFIQEKTVIVVGGGLAGLSAVVEAHNQGHTKVILIEKEKNIGGNSQKATSGINAIEPMNKDSRDAFIQDTLTSGGSQSRQDLVFKLVDESQDALQWLVNQSVFEEGRPTLDLSLVSRCGGHSVGRTHRCPAENGRPVPVGWKLVDTLKKRISSFEKVEVLTEARVLNLLTDQERRIKGVMITKMNPDTGKKSMSIVQADAVVLTSGGFAGQTGHYLPDGQHTLISEYAPQLIDRATTNGPWASGDGVRLATTIGAGVRDMDQIQVHPTGYVDPNSPTAPTKFLAPEAIRAYGAVLLNGQGKRFVDELTLRDRVTAAIYAESNTVHHHPNSWMSKTLSENYPAAYMVLPDETVQGFGESTLGFYVSKGLFKKADGIQGLAELLDVDAEVLGKEFEEYDAYVGHKNADKTGKSFFPCALLPTKQYYVALITPVIHYTMGGLEINTDAAILMKDSDAVIPGLYGAGEVTGGVHGKNRLAGNSLLECVVFGRTAGRNAALYARNKK